MRQLVVVAIVVALSGWMSGHGAAAHPQPSSFTPTSAIVELDREHYYVGAEANLSPQDSPGHLAQADLPFKLPERRNVAFEGTIAFRSPCGAEVLMYFNVDGQRIPAILKLYDGHQVNEFISYHALRTKEGTAVLHVEADGCASNFEVQGLLHVD